MSIDPSTGLDPALTVDYESNWQLRLREKIYAQFRGLPNIQALSDLIAAQTQDLEDAIQSLFATLSIPDASGLGLQLIGRIVGLPYAGESDPIYRLYLQAQILANESSGTPPDLYAVFAGIWSGEIQYQPYYPAAFELAFSGAMTPSVLNVFVTLLGQAKVAGVGAFLGYSLDIPANTFQFLPAGAVGFLTTAVSSGGHSVTMAASYANGWPSRGTVEIDPGIPGIYEPQPYSLTVSGDVATLALGNGLSHAHDAGAVLQLSPIPGATRVGQYPLFASLSSMAGTGAAALVCNEPPAGWWEEGGTVQIVLDDSLPTQEIVSGTLGSGYTITGLTPATGYAHAVGGSVIVTLLDGSAVRTGGRLSGVVNA